ENLYEIVKNALPSYIIEYAAIQTQLLEKNFLTFIRKPTSIDPYPFGDYQTPKSFALYGSIISDSLLPMLKDAFSEITHKRLCESYSYFRIYYNQASLDKHTDRESCQYSATLCLKKDNDWPIYFTDLNGNDVEVEMEPGDLVMYKGTDLTHWRNEYTGNYHIQTFLHYIDMDGPYYPEYKYDRRESLGFPAPGSQMLF
ncbi:hypothetical protein EBS02_03085, partial [bacterium]|nr:hypothetical protein [bacterium]